MIFSFKQCTATPAGAFEEHCGRSLLDGRGADATVGSGAPDAGRARRALPLAGAAGGGCWHQAFFKKRLVLWRHIYTSVGVIR